MIDLTWEVAADGYQWLEEDSGERNPIADDDEEEASASRSNWYLEPQGYTFRKYHPLKEFSALFRDFADLQPSRESILQFANRFGNLGVDHLETVIRAPDGSEEPIEATEGVETEEGLSEFHRGVVKEHRRRDKYGTWEEAIKKLREGVSLWDAIREKRARPGKMETLKLRIEHQLKETNPRVAFVRDEQTGRFSLRIAPIHLLGGLWLQFADAVGYNKNYRQCGTCGRWLELSPEIYRKNRLFCSDACRSKAYRSRKERAIRGAAEEKPPAPKLKPGADTVGARPEKTKEGQHGSETAGTRRGRDLPAAKRREVGRLGHDGADAGGPPKKKGRLRRDQGGNSGKTP